MTDKGEKILSVAVPRPLDRLYTYRLPEALEPKAKPGAWVRVDFGRKKIHAFVVEEPKSKSELDSSLTFSDLKDILEISGEDQNIPKDVFELCQWAKNYYHAPIGEILSSALPSPMLETKKAIRKTKQTESLFEVPSDLQLNVDQGEALEGLSRFLKSDQKNKIALLHGVTGSGKTEVYIELAKRVLDSGKSVLFVVPEIALTPQLHARIEGRVGLEVGLWHSAVAKGQRKKLWEKLHQGKVKVLVGARSAVFAPIQDLGLVIVDEEHEPTFKQEERFRYHARDLAIVRAAKAGALTLLGSATPSLESRVHTETGKYKLFSLKSRVKEATLPEIEIVDLKTDPVVSEECPLSPTVLDEIREVISKKEQVLLFLNRRGFAPFLVCEDCGDVVTCSSCSISMTYHKSLDRLVCHQCGHKTRGPDHCQKCQGHQFRLAGAGTERLEEELGEWLPDARVQRLDRDKITSSSRLEKILSDFKNGKADILLGTQMLAKGHDFPNVTRVVVVLADTLFRWPDFRASERAHQLLTQVGGRAGRAEKPGKVIIQTYAPDHPVLKVLDGRKPEAEFFREEAEVRHLLTYPPYGRMARLRLDHVKRDQAVSRSTELKKLLESSGISPNVFVLGPSQAFIERVRGQYRWELLIKSTSVGDLQKAILLAKAYSKQREWPLLVDVDPYGVG